jgi:hypothetical protein
MPLWHAKQVLGVVPLWLNCAGVQDVVRWQVSHDAITIK